MSPLSPDSLFHFTPSLDNLLSILKNTFYPRYCYEDFDLVDSPPQRFCDVAFPMVCFCDIPLSQLSVHINTYGSYGLGLAKEWGIRKGLNPVIYFSKNSLLAKNIEILTDVFVWQNDPLASAFGETMFYFKPYKGTFYRGGRAVKSNVRFYDEHEWRYVPSGKTLRSQKNYGFLQLESYQDSSSLAQANKELEAQEHRLTFSPNDIKYVIVKEEKEINKMVNALREIKSKRYDPDTIDRLISRIITSKQIRSDF